MGLFSKKPKAIPKINVEGIAVFYDPNHESWEFHYRETDFVVYQPQFTFPPKEELDNIINDVVELTPEMIERITSWWRENGTKANTGQGLSYMIELGKFSEEKTIHIMWSGDDSWGDMGVEYTIKDRRVIDESWGD